ncbi:condensation domain-containing protein [Caballeronia sordidicola]|uniref:condensation domain-containing protein n=1 Tax=Caballeronia sordidicola TaxID=196367 RepID=UPI0034CF2269
MVAKVKGPMSIDQWRHAIGEVHAMHVVLRSRIEVDVTGSPFFILIPECEPSLRIVGTGIWSWEDEVALELQSPFVVGDGPLVRFVLHYNSSCATLIIVAHHAIADGMSAAYLFRDILSVLAEGQSRQANAPIQNLEFIESLETHLVDQMLESAVEGQITPMQSAQPRTANFRPFSGNLPHVEAYALNRACTARLIASSRERGITIHSALGAAYLLPLGISQEVPVLRCAYFHR